ncbi:RNA polymerase II mediator complex subunit [Cadophora gregata]|uniref:RNA polymerase II mediator complex subunit n=1 Tax=Cadophora gregata TaxID=51156 RepID=UPI0026DD05EB|nr:RNA polymerase II mediator complex subunit [Cadophora gregata]KAK0113153.1 RNA polymerase II mediator complex subunit [Cadophora gregata]
MLTSNQDGTSTPRQSAKQPRLRLRLNIMAPASDHDVVEKQVKEAIQDLYQIMVQTNAYDLTSRPSNQVLEAAFKQLDSQLLKLHNTASHAINLPSIPPELIQYVDNGRNPDIYTREFVELARKGNQLMKGKMDAFSSFRDVLACEMGDTMPEIRDDVVKVVLATGGKDEVVEREKGEGERQ